MKSARRKWVWFAFAMVAMVVVGMFACGTVEQQVQKDCTSNSECSRGEVCSSEGRCITECRADRDCDDDEVCNDKGECVEPEPTDDDVDDDDNGEPDAGPTPDAGEPECDADSDCANDGNPCTDAVCEDGSCTFADNESECVVNGCIGVCTAGACVPEDCQPEVPTAELVGEDLKISGPLHLFGGAETVAQTKFLCVARWESRRFECAPYTAGRSTFVPLLGSRRFTPFACTVEDRPCTLPEEDEEHLWAFLADGWRAVDPVAIVDDGRGTGDLVMVIVEEE